jgi:MoaA/NifB/PqqE/SkfB family radical SAM enzyme
MFRGIVEIPRSDPAGALHYLYVSLSNICNARCTYCDVHDAPPPSRTYGAPEFRSLFGDAKAMGCQTVHFMGGGEPLVAPQFAAAIEACAEHNLRVVMTTNGSHLTRRLDTVLRKVHVEAIIVSLDSHQAAVHDEVRKLRNLWNLAVEGIRASKALSPAPKIVLNHVLTRTNLEHLPDFIAFASSIGANAVNLIAVKDRPDMQASAAQRIALARGLDELRRTAAGLGLDLLCRTEDVGVWSKPQDQQLEHEYRCLFPRYALYIDFPTGAVFPCDCTVHRNPQSTFELGNVWKQPLAEIWQGEPVRKIREVLESPCDPGCKRDCDWNNMRTNEFLQRMARPHENA